MGLTQAAAARQIGISRSAVYQHVKSGRLTRRPDGTLDPAEVAEMAESHDPMRSEAGRQAARTRAKRARRAEPGSAPAELHKRLKTIELERAELQWRKDRGLLLDRDEAEQLLADFGHRVRSELQSIPRRMHAAVCRDLRCRSCGEGVDSKVIAIELERFTDDFLRRLADELQPASTPETVH